MRIAVIGLWHLGSVTAGCLAKAGFQVVAYDTNKETIENLKQGKAPIFEPGLDDLLMNPKLKFTADPGNIADAEIIWITVDTPVDDQDRADVAYVTNQVQSLIPHMQEGALVLISSQLPVGTTKLLQEYTKNNFSKKAISFAYSPENLRLGKAIQVFTQPDRVVIGIEDEKDKSRLESLFKPFSDNLIWMSIESAEMTKHAINAFLATSVVFINELSTLCEKVGADARDVERGLKSEERIGPKAYLRPGNAIGGGTLARDVNFLIQTGQVTQTETPFFSSLLTSNAAHKQWAGKRLLGVLKNLKDKNIATLGLTYKAGTDTLRRSTAVELCEWLTQQGATVSAYDPSLKKLSLDLAEFINLKPSLQEALHQADAIVVGTEWPEFHSLTAEHVISQMKQAFVFDASGFLAKNLEHDQRIRYFSVGRNT